MATKNASGNCIVGISDCDVFELFRCGKGLFGIRSAIDGYRLDPRFKTREAAEQWIAEAIALWETL